MGTQQQVQSHAQNPQGRKELPLGGKIILAIVIVLIIATIVATVLIISSQGVTPGSTLAIISIVLSAIALIVGLLTLMVNFFTWRYPVPANSGESSTPITMSPTTFASSTYRGIIGFPPPTNPNTIQQREKAVKGAYEKLIQPNTTAIVLTGIGGIGKSTLAALIYRYAEQQRHARKGPFTTEPLWLHVDPSVTMTDLAGNLCEALGKPIPDLSALSPQNQAYRLFSALNTVDKPRLVILDQFENLLVWKTGHALPDRPGVGEWLDAINSQNCKCRIVLTSRPFPRGTREAPQACMQEYSVERLEDAEGVELLRKQGVQGTDRELHTAVERCKGHAFSLTLLALRLQRRNLTITVVLNDHAYTQLWQGDIATNLLDSIYTEQLDQVQRKLLIAFSVYREPVSLDAAQAIMENSTGISKTQLEAALDALLTQHLLQASGKKRYRLHIIIADYAKSHIIEGDEQANKQALLAGHTKAAQYYLQQAKTSCPPREKRRQISEVHDLIEAIWQYCQAEQWQEAYHLMEKEEIFDDVNRWGGNAILVELYLMLLPSGKWHPEGLQEAKIYNWLGWIYYDFGRSAESLEYYERALEIFRELGDHNLENAVLNNIGQVYQKLGQNEKAIEYYEQAAIIQKAVGNRVEEVRLLNSLGGVYNALGQREEALKYFQEALDISKAAGDRSGEGITLSNLGGIYDALGNKEEALKYFQEALAIHKEVGDRSGEGTTLWHLGVFYFKQDRYDVALAFFLLARDIYEEVLNPDRDGVQNWIHALRSKVGEKQFAALLARVEPQAHQIVEQALCEDAPHV